MQQAVIFKSVHTCSYPKIIFLIGFFLTELSLSCSILYLTKLFCCSRKWEGGGGGQTESEELTGANTSNLSPLPLPQKTPNFLALSLHPLQVLPYRIIDFGQQLKTRWRTPGLLHKKKEKENMIRPAPYNRHASCPFLEWRRFDSTSVQTPLLYGRGRRDRKCQILGRDKSSFFLSWQEGCWAGVGENRSNEMRLEKLFKRYCSCDWNQMSKRKM